MRSLVWNRPSERRLRDEVSHKRGAGRFSRTRLLRGVFAVGSLTAVACAPPASLRPAAGLLPGRDMEVGAAVAGIGPRPYVAESWGVVGQAWSSYRLSSTLELSGLLAFDTTALAAGGALRINWLHTDRLSLAADAELGWLWLGIGLPVSVRLVDEFRVYAAPRLGSWGDEWTPALPLGFSLPLFANLVLRAEAQLTWADFKYYNRRLVLASGLSHQW